MTATLLRNLLPPLDRDRAAAKAKPASTRNAVQIPTGTPAGETSPPSAEAPEIEPAIADREPAAKQEHPTAARPDPLKNLGPEVDIESRRKISEPASVSVAPPARAAEPAVSQPSAADIDAMPLPEDDGAKVGKASQALIAEADTETLVRLEEPLSRSKPAEQPNLAGETELHGAPLPVADDEIVESVSATDALPGADADPDKAADADADSDADVDRIEDGCEPVEAGLATEIPQQPEPVREGPGGGGSDGVSCELTSAASAPEPSELSSKSQGDALAAEIEIAPSEDVASAAGESAKPEAMFPEALTAEPSIAPRGEADNDLIGASLDETPHIVASAESSPAGAEEDAGVEEDADNSEPGLASSLPETEEVPDVGRGVDVDGDAAEELDSPVADAGTGSGIARKPSVYRPRLNRARKRRAPAAATTGGTDFQDLDADLQIFFGPGDWGIEVWALLRLPAAAEEVAILHDGEEKWLSALDDQLLEPLAVADSAAALGEPLLIIAADMPVRWSRSSRDLHVFGQHPTVAGFVSRARVAIGQENAVICRDGLSSAALAQILATGSAEPVRIEGPGVPVGWTCWRGVHPARPSAPAGGLQILHALDPLPAVTVELAGGLQLSRGIWLEGHQPRISLLGLISEEDPVLIDGRAAIRDDDGAWTADGWDRAGAHRIEHGGVTAGYDIDTGADEWDWWPAWRGATAVAGALTAADGSEYFHSQPSAMLIGARPGEVCGFSPATPGVCVARPGFDPVWLITADAGMRRTKASLIGTPASPAALSAGSAAMVTRWARAIAASGRAGTGGSVERRMWNRYVAAARTRRRQSR